MLGRGSIRLVTVSSHGSLPSLRLFPQRDAVGYDEYPPINKSGSNLMDSGVGYAIINWYVQVIKKNTTAHESGYHPSCRLTVVAISILSRWAYILWFIFSCQFGLTVGHQKTTIRVLGGLLSAYHFSDDDPLYLDKAIEFAERIMPVLLRQDYGQSPPSKRSWRLR